VEHMESGTVEALFQQAPPPWKKNNTLSESPGITWKANGVESLKMQRVLPPGNTRVVESFFMLAIEHDSVAVMLQQVFVEHMVRAFALTRPSLNELRMWVCAS
jgi:hypothetical protein